MARKQDRHPKLATRDDAAQWRDLAELAGKVRDRAVGKSTPRLIGQESRRKTHEE